MTSLSDLPELVRDSRLHTYVRDHETIHVRPSARRTVSKHEKWSLVEPIGHGGGGVVWLQRKTEGLGSVRLRAVKGIRTDAEVHTASISRRFVRELEASAKFSQEKYADHFVKSYGWYDVPGWLYITMEYCPHGDLGTYLKFKKALPENQVQDIAGQILEGLSFMHTEGFAHRDLKPSNILVISKPPEDEWWVKLCDLGLSRRSGDASGFTTVRGTPDFMAPETMGAPFIGDPAEADPVKADMWCFGETISRALTGCTTFDRASLLEYQRAKFEFPEKTLRDAKVSQDGINFIRELMMALPSERCDTVQAARNPWMETINDSAFDYPGLIQTSAEYRSSTYQSLSPRSEAQLTQASGQWTGTVPIGASAQLDHLTQASGNWTATITEPLASYQEAESSTMPTSSRESTIGDTLLEARSQTPVVGVEVPPPHSSAPALPNMTTILPSTREPQSTATNEQSHIGPKTQVTDASKRLKPPVDTTPLLAQLRKPDRAPTKPSGKSLVGNNVESALLDSFKQFSAAEKLRTSERKQTRARESEPVKLNDLKRFSETFKYDTPVPEDIREVLSPAAQARLNLAARSRMSLAARPRLEGREQQPPATVINPSRHSQSMAASNSAAGPPLPTRFSGNDTRAGQHRLAEAAVAGLRGGKKQPTTSARRRLAEAAVAGLRGSMQQAPAAVVHSHSNPTTNPSRRSPSPIPAFANHIPAKTWANVAKAESRPADRGVPKREMRPALTINTDVASLYPPPPDFPQAPTMTGSREPGETIRPATAPRSKAKGRKRRNYILEIDDSTWTSIPPSKR